MTGRETWSWTALDGDDWHTGRPSREACIAEAEADGLSDIILQRSIKADPTLVIPTGQRIIYEILRKCDVVMPEAREHQWLQNVPPVAVEDLTRRIAHTVRLWMMDHRLDPGWTVKSEAEGVRID